MTTRIRLAVAVVCCPRTTRATWPTRSRRSITSATGGRSWARARPRAPLQGVPDPDGAPFAPVSRGRRDHQGAGTQRRSITRAPSISSTETAWWLKPVQKPQSADLARRQPSRRGPPCRSPRRRMDRRGRSSTAASESPCRSARRAREARPQSRPFPVSKRVFLSVDERPAVAKAEADAGSRLCTAVPRRWSRRNLRHARAGAGTTLSALVAAGANHLLINPTGRYTPSRSKPRRSRRAVVRRHRPPADSVIRMD